MKQKKIIQIQGEVQLMKREWWQLYKKKWHKHTDFWNNRWWIRFKWDKKSKARKIDVTCCPECKSKHIFFFYTDELYKCDECEHSWE